jgi:hypothetical protein
MWHGLLLSYFLCTRVHYDFANTLFKTKTAVTRTGRCNPTGVHICSNVRFAVLGNSLVVMFIYWRPKSIPGSPVALQMSGITFPFYLIRYSF